MKVAKVWEDNLDCAGACRAPLFWGTKDIRTGPPPRACIYALKDEYDSKVGPIGLTIAAAAIAVYTSFFLHYCMYCGPTKDGEETKGNSHNGK